MSHLRVVAGMLRFFSALCLLLFAFCSLLCASPKRIVSLQPSNTEILFALGAGEQVVGVTTYCDYPPEVKKKEKIGNFIHPNIEKVVSLKPDLVLAGKWKTSTIVPRLRQLGLNVVEVELPSTLEEIYDSILKIGRLVSKYKEAETLVQEMKSAVAQIEQKTKKMKKFPKIYIEVDSPNWTVTKLSFVSDAVERCGTINIFRDLPSSASQVSSEAVVEKNPDVILISGLRKKELLRRAGWKKIAAVKNGAIIDNIGRNLLSRPTPRIVLGMQQLSTALSKMILLNNSTESPHVDTKGLKK